MASAWPTICSSARSCVGVRDLHHLDLVELVLADHAARVAPGAAGLGAEARAVRGELDRQLLGRQDLLAHGVGQRDLAGRDQVLLGLRVIGAASQHPEHVLLELGQLAGAFEHLAVDDVGRVALGVAVLGGLHVQHELRQRPVQPRHRAAQEGEARAAQLGTGVEVQPQRRTQVDVVARRKSKDGARRAPAAHLDVAAFVGTQRHAVVRQVGQPISIAVSSACRPPAARRRPSTVGDAGHLGHRRAGVLALALGLADLLAQCVAPRLQLLGAVWIGLRSASSA
jgi:hypothetical protein